VNTSLQCRWLQSVDVHFGFFFIFEKLTEWRCSVTYLSNDPRIHSKSTTTVHQRENTNWTYIIRVQVLQKFVLLHCTGFMHSYVVIPATKYSQNNVVFFRYSTVRHRSSALISKSQQLVAKQEKPHKRRNLQLPIQQRGSENFTHLRCSEIYLLKNRKISSDISQAYSALKSTPNYKVLFIYS